MTYIPPQSVNNFKVIYIEITNIKYIDLEIDEMYVAENDGLRWMDDNKSESIQQLHNMCTHVNHKFVQEHQISFIWPVQII